MLQAYEFGTKTIPVALKKPMAIGTTKPVDGLITPTKPSTPESFGDWVWR